MSAPVAESANGQLHLIHTDVRGWDGDFKDVRNFLLSAPAIDGPWCPPAAVFMTQPKVAETIYHAARQAVRQAR